MKYIDTDGVPTEILPIDKGVLVIKKDKCQMLINNEGFYITTKDGELICKDGKIQVWKKTNIHLTNSINYVNIHTVQNYWEELNEYDPSYSTYYKLRCNYFILRPSMLFQQVVAFFVCSVIYYDI